MTSAPRPIGLDAAPVRPLPRKPETPPREAFVLPEPARDAPGMERRPEPARARPDTARRPDAPPRGERADRAGHGEGSRPAREADAPKAGAGKSAAQLQGNAAPKDDAPPQAAADPAGGDAAIPVDGAFAAQQVASDAAAALAAEAEGLADETQGAGEDGTVADAEGEDAPATIATAMPPVAAATTPAAAQATAAGDASEGGTAAIDPSKGGKPEAGAAAVAGEEIEAASGEPSVAAASTDGQAKPAKPEQKPTQADAALPEAAKPADNAAKPVAAPATPEIAPERQAAAKPDAKIGEKAAPEAKAAAAAETLGKLEQALQPLAQLQRPAETATPTHADRPPLPEPARPLPPAAVPVEIGLRALQGLKEFQIRLDPAELGRVEVRLEIGDDKSVTAKLVVDRVETLQLLQRDAKTLERAFEQAGLKSTDAGIDITLRDPGQQGRDGRGEAWEGDGQFAPRRPRAEPQPEIQPVMIRRAVHAGALDLSI